MKISHLLALVGCVLLTACAQTGPTLLYRPTSGVKMQALQPSGVPKDVVDSSRAAAQKVADEVSKRRQIDFFNIHSNPIALKIEAGDDAAYVLSFFGTSKERTDLNIEMRVLYSNGTMAFSYNFTGPVTLAGGRTVISSRGKGLSFEFMEGLPGGSEQTAVEDFYGRLENFLPRRYQARSFTFDPVPLIFAVLKDGEPIGYLFTNQGNRLVLGERKYADVQSIAYASQGEVKDAYTIIAFNDKTTGSTDSPVFSFEEEEGMGLLAQCGDF